MVVLALVSTAWSANAWLTLRRAGSLAVLFAIGACLLAATRGRPEGARRLLVGVLAGAVAVGIVGLGTLVFDHDAAVQPASTQYPARFQGFEQNPDTAALLFALVIPVATYLLLTARSWLRRAALAAAILLFAGSIARACAGRCWARSRGRWSSSSMRRRPAPRRAGSSDGRRVRRVPGDQSNSQAKPAPPSTSGTPPIRRTLFTLADGVPPGRCNPSSDDRPIAGYGFGTEALVFVDRYSNFQSDLVENVYIGAALQLGVVGLALLLAVAGSALLPFARAPSKGIQAACAGVAVAALVVAVTQSYLFSVGNIGTGTAWVSLFRLAGLVAGPQTEAAASSERIPSREMVSSHSG